VDTLILALRVILSLGAVVAVLWLLQRRISRGARGIRTEEPLRILARRGLGSKASVVVVETAGQRFVLGVTEHAVNVLHTSDAPAPVPAAAAPAPAATTAPVPAAAAPVPAAATAAAPAPIGADAFARTLDGHTEQDLLRPRSGASRTRAGQTASGLRPMQPFGGNQQAGALHGSLLSAATWRQAAAAVRKGLSG
jgi:flagellar protein FliO/FliZ